MKPKPRNRPCGAAGGVAPRASLAQESVEVTYTRATPTGSAALYIVHLPSANQNGSEVRGAQGV